MSNILDRATSQVGKLTYKLGRGGYTPEAEYAAPLTLGIPRKKILPIRARWCDCSGFVAWCLGRSRKPDKTFRWWLSTDSIYHDAKHGQILFTQVDLESAQPGDILVYPDWKDADGKHHEGHVAIIADPVSRTIIDCSSTYNCSARDGRAMFKRFGVVCCRYVP